jgi:hypothetical protein
MKLAKYYELIIYSILPKEVIDQIYKLVPGIEQYISQTLSYENLTFCDDNFLVYKDISFLAHNRVTHMTEIENDDAEPIEGEIMVIDVLSAEDNVDNNYITYFQSQPYNGQLTYTNLANINE